MPNKTTLPVINNSISRMQFSAPRVATPRKGLTVLKLVVGLPPANPLMIKSPTPCVLDPMITSVPAGAREIGVPEMVMAGAPRVKVRLPMTKSDAELAV